LFVIKFSDFEIGYGVIEIVIWVCIKYL